MPHRTLKLEEVAQYLNLGTADVERLVRDQRIPHEKHGPRLVFRKVEIDTWASARVLGMERRKAVDYERRSSELTSRSQAFVTDLAHAGAVDPSLQAKTKASVLREMAHLGATTGHVVDVTALLEQLKAREAIESTGLPGGVALVHPSQPEDWLFDAPFIALGRSIQRVPFGAPDGQHTDLFFLVACPEPSLHLHVLARLCVLFQTTALLPNLRTTNSGDEMLAHLASAEQEYLATAANRGI